jgi:hypothetical protein
VRASKTYNCLAKNVFGSGKIGFELNKLRPTVVKIESPFFVTKGKTVNLRPKVDHDPYIKESVTYFQKPSSDNSSQSGVGTRTQNRF